MRKIKVNDKKNQSRACQAAILAAAALWGTIGLFVQPLSAAGFSDVQLVAVRAAVTALALFVMILLRDPALLRVRPRDLWLFAGGGICSFVFFNLCYFGAIRLTGMTTAAILLYTAPVFVTLMSALFFKEKLTKFKLLALPLALGGCVLVSLGGGVGGVSVPGIALGVASGFGYALYSIFGHAALARYNYLTVTFYNFLFASAGILPFALAQPLPAMSGAETPLRLLALGVFTAVLPYALYTLGLAGTEASRASIIACCEPVVASVLGVTFNGDPLTAATALGVLLVLGAVAVIASAPDGKNKKTEISK